MGGGGGGSKTSEKNPPFFWVENHELLVFFDFEPKKCFRIGFVWGEVGRALMQFMHFSAIFAMLAVLADPVTPWYPL